MSALIYGPVVTPTTRDAYDALPRCLLAVGQSGHIEWMEDDVSPDDLQNVLARKGCVNASLLELKRGEFLIPGFVDTHTHAPQFPNIGNGQTYELMDWLDNVTFPGEAKFADIDYARTVYASVVRRTIAFGTTTCCYYGTIHLEATQALSEIVNALGQRAFVGKCNMNRSSPAYYIESSVEESVRTTQELMMHIRSLPQTTSQVLVQPIITPRFAISCTDQLLGALGQLAAEDPSLRIQTHISENPTEVAVVRELFPDAGSYARVYDIHGLLTERTILAHAVHLDQAEMQLIRDRRAGISHCPTSNFNLRSGMAPVGKFLDMGIKVGLGTDVSGGYSPSILNAIRNASITAKMIAIQNPSSDHGLPTPASSDPMSSLTEPFENRQLPIATLFYLATLGGADVCGLAPDVGSLRVGSSFDALVVSVNDGPSVWGGMLDDDGALEKDVVSLKRDLEEMLERFMFGGDDRNIKRVYVQGRCIGGCQFSESQ